MEIFVLGIDPGRRHTGLVVLRSQGSPQILRSHTFTGPPAELGRELRDWKTGLTAAGIEDQRYVQRGKTERGETNFAATAVRDSQWAAVGALTALGVPVTLVQPSTIKKTLTGSSKATKTQMLKFAQMRWPYITNEHLADAATAALIVLKQCELSVKPAIRAVPTSEESGRQKIEQAALAAGCTCMLFAKHYSFYLISKAACPVHQDRR